MPGGLPCSQVGQTHREGPKTRGFNTRLPLGVHGCMRVGVVNVSVINNADLRSSANQSPANASLFHIILRRGHVRQCVPVFFTQFYAVPNVNFFFLSIFTDIFYIPTLCRDQRQYNSTKKCSSHDLSTIFQVFCSHMITFSKFTSVTNLKLNGTYAQVRCY